MKQFFLVAGVSVISLCTNAQGTDSSKTVQPSSKSSLDSFSYALGMNIGNSLKQQGLTEIKTAEMVKAMEDVLGNKATVLNEQQANMIIQTTLQANASKKSDAEKARSAGFLETNKQRQGVVTLPSGLQYEVIKSGDAKSDMPQLQDTVVAHYAGTLVDGKEFDNSYKRGEPLTIPVAGVIKGWTEILQKMHIGDKWKVFIPSELGYGERGAGQDIPGGAALIFEMELMQIKKAGIPQPDVETKPGKQKAPATKATTKKPAASKAPVKKKN
ncbi:MAG: FKBP-type peptidyl-prolyl cis-trans isomerase [Bacteroidota bacterium]